MGNPRLYIIDGHSQVFKAYHAIQHLSTSAGIPTNAVFGFCQILHRLLKIHQPEYIVVAFDTGTPTFRHEMYEAYKANRPPPPEDLQLQMEYISRVLDGMRIPTLRMEGFEADDIIATIARRAEESGFDVVVVTADKDLFQLVNDRVRILRLDPDKEIEFDREAVKQKMGVYPEQILDFLAMVGDSSDNIPGIHKVGPKTAVALLERFGTLDRVLENTAQLKGKQREYMEAGRENAILSRRLAQLRFDVPVGADIKSFHRHPPDTQALAPLYRELEFRRFLDDVQEVAVAREAVYRTISSPDELEAFCANARDRGVVAFDTETDSLAALTANLVGISLSCSRDEAVYIPVGHKGALDSPRAQMTLDDVFRILDPVLRDPRICKAGHNLKFDRKVLLKYGFDVASPMFDTLIASYLLNPDKRTHGLKDLAADLLGIRMTPLSDLIGTGKGQITFADVDIDAATRYSGADADCTLQLRDALDPRLDEYSMRELFDQIEMPLIDVLLDMELCGVCIDEEHFAALGIDMSAHLDTLRSRILELVGHDFNLSSPKQVAVVLFEELKLTPGRKLKSGFSTDVDVLEALAVEHEVPRLLLEFRQYEKLKGTYVDVLPGMVDRTTGRIHTTYHQAVAATGRLSSSDPNLQHIPVRTETGRKIRRGFVPSRPGNLLLAADYSQIELRVLAHVSKDPGLVEAFRENRDVHTLTASKIFNTDLNLVTEEMRERAKVVNFGIIYGMSPQGLSQRLAIPFAEAKKFIDEYFNAYEGVRAWIDGTLEAARKRGFVTTLGGRRRYLADINSPNFNARNAAERVAMNAPIQGSSADMIKIAMICIHKWLKESDLRTRMIMQVHDELIFDVPGHEMEEVEPRVRVMMQDALPLDVPVHVDVKKGRNWAEC
jgi:DNA polymerase-1